MYVYTTSTLFLLDSVLFDDDTFHHPASRHKAGSGDLISDPHSIKLFSWLAM